MTDNLHYQDVFETNTLELKQNVGLHAEYLLNAAQNTDFKDPKISKYLRSSLDTPEVTQAIWELSSKRIQAQRLLAITVMGDYFRIGINLRPTLRLPQSYKVSIDGNYAAATDTQAYPSKDNRVERDNKSFYDVFYETVAALGLRRQLLQVFGTQKESSSESFARAA